MSRADIVNPITKLPAQEQMHQPGLQSEMHPLPRGFMELYKPSGKLENRVVLITGGDSGIGRAVAIGCAKEGADVAIVYLEEDEDAHITRERVQAEGRRCHLIRGDISDEKFCQEAVRETVTNLGMLDVLINNAAEQHANDDFETLDMEQMEETFRTNIFSIFYLSKAALPHMTEGDSIINTASVTAYRGHKELVDYAATKGAIVALTRSLAQQLAERGIRVNAVAPGPIWTPLIPASFSAKEVSEFGQNTALGRPGQPDEVAPCYIFLASDDASYITGQVLHPNGGTIINA